MTPESWLLHPLYCDYAISTHGRVRSHKRPTALILRQKWAGSGYLAVKLFLDSVAHYPYVGRLVLETFVGPRPEGMETCHNDGAKTNNRLDNLRWDTHANNCADMVVHGTFSRNGARFDDDEVRTIRGLVAAGAQKAELARHYGVSGVSIGSLIHGRTYRHV